jgi:hypothetical protein
MSNARDKANIPALNFSSTGIDDNATSTAITINSSENVGIGTSSPTAKLEINAGDTFQQMKIRRGTGGTDAGIITFEQGDGTAVGHVGGVGAGGLQLRTGSGTGTERMRIDSSGNVGIGTSSPSPDYGSDTVLEVSGSASPGIVINDTGQASKYGIHADSNDLKITYGSSALTTFQNDGNVGIGTSSPAYKFHVEGINSTRFAAVEDTGLIVGGFGASGSGGVLDWNDASNARSGNGTTLLQGSATNGPGGSTYFHSFSFEYESKGSTGNMTQLAIAYNSATLRYMRYRFSGTWSAWSSF